HVHALTADALAGARHAVARVRVDAVAAAAATDAVPEAVARRDHVVSAPPAQEVLAAGAPEAVVAAAAVEIVLAEGLGDEPIGAAAAQHQRRPAAVVGDHLVV